MDYYSNYNKYYTVNFYYLTPGDGIESSNLCFHVTINSCFINNDFNQKSCEMFSKSLDMLKENISSKVIFDLQNWDNKVKIHIFGVDMSLCLECYSVVDKIIIGMKMYGILK